MSTRTIIVFSRDHELAEIAAIGLRVTAGWKAVVATTPHTVCETASQQSVYAILSIALTFDSDVLREVRDLNLVGCAISAPVIVVTPEPLLYQQLQSFGVLPICTPFDPLVLSDLITEAVTSIPRVIVPLSNIAHA